MTSRYSASFTAGSLLHKETSALLPLILSDNAEKLIRDEVNRNELLLINSESARKRTVHEIIKRFKQGETAFWRHYATSNDQQQKTLLFYLCLKSYALMFDFHINVTLKQWRSSSRTADPYFYQMEMEEIAARDEKVEGWSDTTKRKAISVYMRILRDINLLNSQNELQPIHFGDEFWKYFVTSNELWFLDACLLDLSERERIMRL